MRLGMFGGTFNPPHLAHLIAGELVTETYELDKLLFVPANIPPHKTEQAIAAPSDRLAMTALAIEGNPKFEVSAIEIEREGTSYTIDTIREIKSIYEVNDFCLFIGMDNLAIFGSWYRSEEILAETRVIVMARPTHDIGSISDELRQQVEFFPLPLLEISSTAIRERIEQGRSIRYLVPDAVGSYIEDRKLYR